MIEEKMSKCLKFIIFALVIWFIFSVSIIQHQQSRYIKLQELYIEQSTNYYNLLQDYGDLVFGLMIKEVIENPTLYDKLTWWNTPFSKDIRYFNSSNSPEYYYSLNCNDSSSCGGGVGE